MRYLCAARETPYFGINLTPRIFLTSAFSYFADYSYGIRLSQRVDGKVLVTFNARNEHDRCKFVEDLRESISEMDEMETLRIETELERQKSSRGARGGAENRDSGVADVEICPCPGTCSERAETVDVDTQLKRSALSNSLLDIHEQCK